MDTSFETKKRNDGYNVKRLREILGIKQEDLAEKLQISQQTMSKMEQKEILEDTLLDNIAKALHISVDVIKNFREDAAANFINTFHDQSGFNYQCSFNPLDKVIELYERMLKAEQEKVSILEKMLKDKK